MYISQVEAGPDDYLDIGVIVRHDFQVCSLRDWVVPIIESRNIGGREYLRMNSICLLIHPYKKYLLALTKSRTLLKVLGNTMV